VIILAAMSVTWFIVRQSARIDHWIGAEGAVIPTSGFLLAALAVEVAVLEFANCFCSNEWGLPFRKI